MHSPDILDIVPEHVADPVRRDPWRERLLRGSGDAILSLLLNGFVVAGMIGVGWPLHPIEAPHTISVDLVDHMPETKSSGAAAGAGASEKAGGSEAEAHTSQTEAQKGPEKKAQADPKPELQATAQAQPAKPAEIPPEPQAAPEPSPASEASAQPAERPAEKQAVAADVPPRPDRTTTAQAVPPPPENPDGSREARLVEAPSAPPPAAAQSETPNVPKPAPIEDGHATPTAEPPAQRPVLSAPDGEGVVPSPTPPPEIPKPLTAEEKRQAAATATLAAMLPFGANIEASPFQAAAPAQGQGASTAYRGAVYANFNKAQDVIADAKARHLKGQAVIAFTVDDHGGLANIGVAVSSGNQAVDQAALEMIRRAAPFPPPPPGAQRSFSPAIGLGLDD